MLNEPYRSAASGRQTPPRARRESEYTLSPCSALGGLRSHLGKDNLLSDKPEYCVLPCVFPLHYPPRFPSFPFLFSLLTIQYPFPPSKTILLSLSLCPYHFFSCLPIKCLRKQLTRLPAHVTSDELLHGGRWRYNDRSRFQRCLTPSSQRTPPPPPPPPPF